MGQLVLNKYALLFILLSLGPGQGDRSTITPHSGKLEIHIINVGQGDAALIRCPHGIHEILIDSGDRSPLAVSGRPRRSHVRTTRPDGDNPCGTERTAQSRT